MMRSIYLIIATSLVLGSCAQDQIVSATFETGREHNFTLRRSKSDPNTPGLEKMAQRTKVRATFTPHDEGVKAEWVYGATDVEGATGLMQELTKEQLDMLNLYRGVKIDMLLDPSGAYMGLLNYDGLKEQVRDAFLRMYATGLAKSNIDQYNKMKEQIEMTFRTEDLLLGTYFPEVPLYFGLFGDTLDMSGYSEEAILCPNPFGGEEFPAIRRIRVTKSDGSRIDVEITEVPDSAESKRILVNTMRAMSEKLDNPRKFDDVPELSLNYTTIYEYSPVAKLMRRAQRKKTITTNGSSIVESLEVAYE